MIRTAVTLDLTKYDTDAAARHRRIFNALSSCDSGTLVRLVVDRDAYFDDSMSTIAGLTLDCDVEITGANPQHIRQYARLLSTFQQQRRTGEAGIPQ